jgi:regulator of replication initiation timing
MTDNTIETSPAMQQINMLNLRIRDIMTQLNNVIKTLMDENTTLKKENAGLKDKLEKTNNKT